jgi:hypothetical protein
MAAHTPAALPGKASQGVLRTPIASDSSWLSQSRQGMVGAAMGGEDLPLGCMRGSPVCHIRSG